MMPPSPRYKDRVASVDARTARRQAGEAPTEDEAEDIYLERLGAGLFTLQLLAAVIASVVPSQPVRPHELPHHPQQPGQERASVPERRRLMPRAAVSPHLPFTDCIVAAPRAQCAKRVNMLFHQQDITMESVKSVLNGAHSLTSQLLNKAPCSRRTKLCADMLTSCGVVAIRLRCQHGASEGGPAGCGGGAGEGGGGECAGARGDPRDGLIAGTVQGMVQWGRGAGGHAGLGRAFVGMESRLSLRVHRPQCTLPPAARPTHPRSAHAP